MLKLLKKLFNHSANITFENYLDKLWLNNSLIEMKRIGYNKNDIKYVMKSIKLQKNRI